MEPTRLEVNQKLETLIGKSQSEMYAEMVAWARDNSSKPEMILGDLLSYSIYTEAA